MSASESESRHAFLLRLGDALRLLVDPTAMQEEASRLLGERLLTDRAYYADIDEAQGSSWSTETSFAPVSRAWSDDIRWARSIGWVRHLDGRTGGRGRRPNLALIPARSSGGRRCRCGGVRRGALDQGRPAGRGAVRDRPFTAGLDSRGSRTGEGNRGADLGGHRTRPRRVQFGKPMLERLVPGHAGARTQKPARPIRTGLELIRRGGDTAGAVERVRGMMERQSVTWSPD